MIDFKAELRQRLQALYEIALDFLDEDEARDLFCSITKRRRGKRGLGRNPNPHPEPEAERKRRARDPARRFKIEVERELTETDLRRLEQSFTDRLTAIADKR
jgi:hypothetical protein